MTAARLHDAGAGLRRTLIDRRTATLGRHAPLLYDDTPEFVQASGVWLTDRVGRRYLDAYNNVPHVGHSHRRVVQALAKQAERLNVHTCYLDEILVGYAEMLLGLFDPGLGRVSCGSESNELALRIARQHTGNTGVLVSDQSYHGNPNALAQITTALTVHEQLGDHGHR